MTLFLACNDVFRNCTPADEYFDFGVWMPPDEKAQAPGSAISDSGSDASESVSEVSEGGTRRRIRKKKRQASVKSTSSSETPPPPAPGAPPVVDEKKVKFEAEFAQGAPATAIADLVRAEGFAPSMAELKALHEKLGDNITYEDFVAFKKESKHSDDKPDTIASFFKAFDPTNDGTLSRKQIRNLLMTYGEPLTESETDMILSEMGFTEDKINYHELAAKLLEN